MLGVEYGISIVQSAAVDESAKGIVFIGVFELPCFGDAGKVSVCIIPISIANLRLRICVKAGNPGYPVKFIIPVGICGKSRIRQPVAHAHQISVSTVISVICQLAVSHIGCGTVSEFIIPEAAGLVLFRSSCSDVTASDDIFKISVGIVIGYGSLSCLVYIIRSLLSWRLSGKPAVRLSAYITEKSMFGDAIPKHALIMLCVSMIPFQPIWYHRDVSLFHHIPLPTGLTIV